MLENIYIRTYSKHNPGSQTSARFWNFSDIIELGVQRTLIEMSNQNWDLKSFVAQLYI